ncbi:MAG: glutaredoxin family protein [Pirellulales bacterium]
MPFVLYSRRGCHLCDQAEELLFFHGVDAAVIDVDSDDAARERFGLRVPVLEIDGVVAMEGRFDECELVRVLAVDRRSQS